MAEIRGGNWAFRDPGGDIPAGSTIYKGNFSQAQPDTPIMVGKVLTIIDGNFTNVRQDPNWTIHGGNWTQVSFCAYLHPTFGLPAEPDHCPHVTETHTVSIDGQVVQTEYDREDTIL